MSGLATWFPEVIEFVAAGGAPSYNAEEVLWATLSLDVSALATFAKYTLVKNRV